MTAAKVRFGQILPKPGFRRWSLHPGWEGQKCAMCGRLWVVKENLHVAPLVGAAMCSAYRMRFT